MLNIEKEEHQRVANIKERIVEKLGELKSNLMKAGWSRSSYTI